MTDRRSGKFSTNDLNFFEGGGGAKNNFIFAMLITFKKRALHNKSTEKQILTNL